MPLPVDIDVDFLTRSMARGMSPHELSSLSVDADAIDVGPMLREKVRENSQWYWSDVLAVVPIVQIAYIGYRDRRPEFRAAANEWLARVRGRLAMAVSAVASRRHAACRRALSRIASLSRFRLDIATLDLDLEHATSPSCVETRQRLTEVGAGRPRVSC